MSLKLPVHLGMFKPFGSIFVFTIGNAVIHLTVNHFGFRYQTVFKPYIFESSAFAELAASSQSFVFYRICVVAVNPRFNSYSGCRICLNGSLCNLPRCPIHHFQKRKSASSISERL
jgi:hypothetical protein